MKRRKYLFLFLFSLAFYIAVSLLQKTPGYMDASYYFATGQLLARGQWAEPFLWNYLNSPTVISEPVFSYWMPLAGILAALPVALSGINSFQVARTLFILLAAFIPLLVFLFTEQLTENKVVQWLSAGLGLVAGYYLPYLTITETFVPFMLLGALFFVGAYKILRRPTEKNGWLWVLLGILAGLMHLSRADGVLWLLGALLFALVAHQRVHQKLTGLLLQGLLVVAGYLLIMSGWFLRNLSVYGWIFPPGSSLTLRMTNYNDLFIYPASQLTWQRLFSSGAKAMLSVRWDALFTNLQSLVGIVGGIVLFPFLLAGLWQLRKEKLIQFALWMLLLQLIVMSFVFPFAGARGGFFHSASAFQILFWAVSALGFERSIWWIAAKRKWQVKKSIPLLGTTLWIVFAVITSLNFYLKVVGIPGFSSGWDAAAAQYQRVDDFLNSEIKDPAGKVVINDSPGFYVATGRVAIQQANCDLETLQGLMTKLDVEYLVVGPDHLAALDDLFAQPRDQQGFTYLGSVGESVIYEKIH